jgi:23S rRNA (cytosine1962-C5)-methyltransferase
VSNVILKKGRERSVLRRHPWIFSGAIERVDGDVEAGDIVHIVSGGEKLATGYYNPNSKIRVRVLDWSRDARIDDAWWRERLRSAIELRAALPGGIDSDALRLVYSEADAVPGLIVDRYGDCLVVQALTAGVERHKDAIVRALGELVAPKTIYERSDADARSLEGLEPAKGLLAGEPLDGPVEIAESILRFRVSIESGHKTGFYLDQRDNRRTVAAFAAGRTVLDLFSYSGGFAVTAAAASASEVTLVDSSAEALDAARRNAELNDVAGVCETVQGNAFEVVRALYGQEQRYGLVICDPPRLAPSRGQRARAERAYKDINMNAMRLVEPGGTLASFSCSGALDAADFSKIIAWAAIDAGREVRILRRLSQAPDHPVDPCFPESEYLKGVICRVI